MFLHASVNLFFLDVFVHIFSFYQDKVQVCPLQQEHAALRLFVVNNQQTDHKQWLAPSL